MDKGTILYIGGFEFPDKNAAAKLSLNYAEVFKKIGYNVVLVGVDRSRNANFKILDSKKDILGFDIWSIQYPLRITEWLRHLVDIEDIICVMSQYSNIRAIICYNYQSIAFLRLVSYCKDNNIKIISNTTEWYGNSNKNLVFNFIKNLDTFIRMKIANKKADGLILTSKYLDSYYNRLKTIIIPSISQPSNFSI